MRKHAIDIIWNTSHFLYQHNIRLLARVFELLSMTISSHAVSAQIQIGKGTIFYHHALGCVVLESVEIGRDCKIFQSVTIGNTFSPNENRRGGYCSIGDNVLIGAGACVLGNIKIGNNVRIGANAVVLNDIPDNAVVVGVPGEIVRLENQR